MKKAKTSEIMKCTAKAAVDFADLFGVDITSEELLRPEYQEMVGYTAGVIRALVESVSGQKLVHQCDTPGCDHNHDRPEMEDGVQAEPLSYIGTFRDGGSKAYKDSVNRRFWLDNRLTTTTKGVLYAGHPNDDEQVAAVGSFILLDINHVIHQS